MGKRKTTEQFIKEAKTVHGDKYDYSKVNYINNKTKVCITCKICGYEFWQKPCLHLKGEGCFKCANKQHNLNQRKNNEWFISKAKLVHGDKYDYSKVDYINSYTKVCIVCPVHGEFWQRPNSHLEGIGCPKCGNDILKSTTKQFIEKAKLVHGEKYDYSKVEYVNSKTKVIIICQKHGEFSVIPNNHLNGNGCPKCALENSRRTTEEFISKAKLVHGDKYDYSKVEYKDSETKVCIICPEHGDFYQSPHGHLKGQGCPKCAENLLRSTTEEFISKAKLVHGDKYDYSKVEYVNNVSPVCIVCPKHDEFYQTPSAHLQGEGCKKCSDELRTKTTEEFISKAKLVHGDKYDYSKTNYINAHTKVCVICPEHGEFWQYPYSHAQGRGCSICNESQGEKKIRVWCEQNKLILTEDYIQQYQPDWLGKQSLDFYFPKLNLGVEYDGGQHFFPVEHFGGESSLQRTQELDNLKNKICKQNNIKLIRIPYWDYENIETILTTYIKLGD